MRNSPHPETQSSQCGHCRSRYQIGVAREIVQVVLHKQAERGKRTQGDAAFARQSATTRQSNRIKQRHVETDRTDEQAVLPSRVLLRAATLLDRRSGRGTDKRRSSRWLRGSRSRSTGSSSSCRDVRLLRATARALDSLLTLRLLLGRSAALLGSARRSSGSEHRRLRRHCRWRQRRSRNRAHRSISRLLLRTTALLGGRCYRCSGSGSRCQRAGLSSCSILRRSTALLWRRSSRVRSRSGCRVDRSLLLDGRRASSRRGSSSRLGQRSLGRSAPLLRGRGRRNSRCNRGCYRRSDGYTRRRRCCGILGWAPSLLGSRLSWFGNSGLRRRHDLRSRSGSCILRRSSPLLGRSDGWLLRHHRCGRSWRSFGVFGRAASLLWRRSNRCRDLRHNLRGSRQLRGGVLGRTTRLPLGRRLAQGGVDSVGCYVLGALLLRSLGQSLGGGSGGGGLERSLGRAAALLGLLLRRRRRKDGCGGGSRVGLVDHRRVVASRVRDVLAGNMAIGEGAGNASLVQLQQLLVAILSNEQAIVQDGQKMHQCRWRHGIFRIFLGGQASELERNCSVDVGFFRTYQVSGVGNAVLLLDVLNDLGRGAIGRRSKANTWHRNEGEVGARGEGVGGVV